jgi:hypothetical protein
MAEPELLARMYHVIMSRLMNDGRAPHYTELASTLGLCPDEARDALHDLGGVGIPGFWLHPGTDYVVAFAPFSNLPTQYLISVEGEQKWYGQ